MKKLRLIYALLIGLLASQTYVAQSFTLPDCSSALGSNLYGPMNSVTTANSKNRTAFIIPASQLAGISGGTLTSTYFKRFTSTGTIPAGATFSIYLKNTTATDFGSTALTWATEIASATLVYSGDPSTAVGSTAGYKQFVHSTNFDYTSGSNLAVYMEYTQTTGASSTITWEYEYTAPCINTGNSNTTKYTNTTGALSATLGTGNYRRAKMGFDVTYPPATAAPTCTSLTAPANSATGVSVTPTLTWAGVYGQNGATDYLLNVGTTPGGTDILNAFSAGAVTSYAVPTAAALLYDTTYYVTVTPLNAVGAASACTETSFTTTATIPCPAVTAPTSSQTGVSTSPTFTWNPVTNATGYTISIGTTSGGTDVLNAVPLGNTTTYTYTGVLNPSTVYYYTISAQSATGTSATCSVRSFTTVCGSYTPYYSNDFSSVPGACWTQGAGGSPATGVGTGTTNYWVADGFLNNGSTGAARINLYNTDRTGWLISPTFDLSAGGYRLKLDYGITAYTGTAASAMGSDDLVQVVVSTDGGTTWTVLQTWNQANAPDNTQNTYTYNLVGYTASAVKFAIYATDGTVNDAEDYNFYVDNFIVEAVPTCDIPTSVNFTSATQDTAGFTWAAPAGTTPTGYTMYYSTVNTAPTSTTVLDGTNSANSASPSITLSSLTPSTTYYVWVRANCSATDVSAWVAGPSFATLCAPFTAPFAESFSSGAVPNCWSNVNPTTTSTSTSAFWKFSGAPEYGASIANSVKPAGTFAWVDASTPYTGEHTVQLITPQINLAGLTAPYLQFEWYKNHLTTASGTTVPAYDNNKLLVHISSDGTTWTEVFADDTNSSVWRTVGIPLPSSFVGGTVQVRFTVDKDVAGNGYFYDDLLLDEVAVIQNPNLATTEVISQADDIKVYPNPFTDVITVSNVKDLKSLTVVDVSGRIVKMITNPGRQVNLSELKAGLYILKLDYKDGNAWTFKVIKK